MTPIDSMATVGTRIRSTSQVTNTLSGHARTGTTQLMKSPAPLQRIDHHQAHTLGQGTTMGQRRTMPTKRINQPTQHRTITIPDLRGIVRLGGTQLNCCPPTTPDTEYNPETASTLGFRPSKSKRGRTVKLRLA
jgi:hypothetical protein